MNTRSTRSGRAAATLLPLLAAAAGLLGAGGAQAEASPYFIGGSVNWQHDSNLLRLTDTQSTPDGYTKADSVTSLALLAGLDQSFGRQHAYGNLALRSNRFANNTLYNNRSYTLSGGLDWSTAERVSGSLSGSASRNLSSFNLQEIGLLREKNLESVQSIDAAVRVGLVTQYSLELLGGHRQVKNSADVPSVQSRNYKQDVASVGLHWSPSANSNFGLALRETRGRYPKFRPIAPDEYEADRFKRSDLVFTAAVKPSGASTLDLRLSSGKTNYDLSTQRNFSGLTGSLGWYWQASSKLRVKTNLSRDTGQDSYALTTFFGTPGTVDYSRVTSSLRTKIDYDVSPKLSFFGIAAWSRQALVRTLPTLPGFGDRRDEGSDHYTTTSLGARWTVQRSLSLGCDFTHDRRKGTGVLGSSVSDSTTSCFAQFVLQ